MSCIKKKKKNNKKKLCVDELTKVFREWQIRFLAKKYTAESVCDVYNITIDVFAVSQFLSSHSVADKNNVFNILTRYLKRVSTFSAFHPSRIYCLVKTSENSAAGSRLRREKKIKHKVRNTIVLCNSVWATRRGTLSGRSRKEILFLKRRRKKYV